MVIFVFWCLGRKWKGLPAFPAKEACIHGFRRPGFSIEITEMLISLGKEIGIHAYFSPSHHREIWIFMQENEFNCSLSKYHNEWFPSSDPHGHSNQVKFRKLGSIVISIMTRREKLWNFFFARADTWKSELTLLHDMPCNHSYFLEIWGAFPSRVLSQPAVSLWCWPGLWFCGAM